ncbi:hypothetical protein LEP1GSC124_4253 [Leptospira interrogans serovar Pyrogenes str. 200701872]|uniref:Uncharacterized protein n=1 Tax=Leptospira interrogans serovar Pyrogenes str. 200701872 TaxID=1193029 RepID=M6ZHP1_LEPIR|nr:hypothetical protein LEP1GSC124_4253 [Leptospira interrogans serovar Pyrogenes str. 200701872]
MGGGMTIEKDSLAFEFGAKDFFFSQSEIHLFSTSFGS